MEFNLIQVILCGTLRHMEHRTSQFLFAEESYITLVMRNIYQILVGNSEGKRPLGET